MNKLSNFKDGQAWLVERQRSMLVSTVLRTSVFSQIATSENHDACPLAVHFSVDQSNASVSLSPSVVSATAELYLFHWHKISKLANETLKQYAHKKLWTTYKISTMCPKTCPPFHILNSSAKNEPILIIFGVHNQEKISHTHLAWIISLTHLAWKFHLLT